MTPTKIHLTFRTDASGSVLIDKASPEPFVGSEEFVRAQGWRPIESAPRDLRDYYDTPMPKECYVLLGFSADDVSPSDIGMCVGYWDAYYAEGGNGYYRGCSPWVIAAAGETTDLHYGYPTHWMSLPPSPSEKGVG